MAACLWVSKQVLQMHLYLYYYFTRSDVLSASKWRALTFRYASLRDCM